MTKLEQLVQRAQNAENKLNAACEAIAAEVQKKIEWDTNISCEYQPSDGFVIVIDDPNSNAPLNQPLSYFIDTWKDHKTYTKRDIEHYL